MISSFSFFEKGKKKSKNHPFILTYTRGRTPARAESGCVDVGTVHTTYSIHVHVPMYEVDRVYGLTESGKNLSLSLSLLARARMGGNGGRGNGNS